MFLSASDLIALWIVARSQPRNFLKSAAPTLIVWIIHKNICFWGSDSENTFSITNLLFEEFLSIPYEEVKSNNHWQQGRIHLVRLGGAAISVIFGSQVSIRDGFTTVRGMQYTSKRCCDKTMDGKIALYRVCCFPKYTQSWSINLLSQVLGGRSPQSPHTSAPDWTTWAYVVTSRLALRWMCDSPRTGCARRITPYIWGANK